MTAVTDIDILVHVDALFTWQLAVLKKQQWQRQQKCHPKSELALLQTTLIATIFGQNFGDFFKSWFPVSKFRKRK